MSRLIGLVAGLLLIVVLPLIAKGAQTAIPALVSVLFFLGVLRLALPPRRRRR